MQTLPFIYPYPQMTVTVLSGYQWVHLARNDCVIRKSYQHLVPSNLHVPILRHASEVLHARKYSDF